MKDSFGAQVARSASTERSLLFAGHATHRGRDRAVNQDAVGLPDQLDQDAYQLLGHLYAVADGVGGHAAGEAASRAAIDVLYDAYYRDPDEDRAAALRRAILAANTGVRRLAESLGHQELGSTLVAVVAHGTDLIVANVGDSRAYLWRRGKLLQLTQDHSWVAERVAAGLIAPEDAAQHELRHVITRSLGHRPEIDVDMHVQQIESGDRLLLCCDGVWEFADHRSLLRLLGKRWHAQQIAQACVEQALKAGSRDDVTALVVAVGDSRTPATVERKNMWRMGGLLIGVGLLALVVWSVYASLGRLSVASIVQLEATATTLPSSRVLQSVPVSAQESVDELPLALTPTLSPRGGPTPTPTASALPPTSTPVETMYCIVPAPNVPSQPANDVSLANCVSGTGRSIPNGAAVDVGASRSCGSMQLRSVRYQGEEYLIYAWRVGQIDPVSGECVKP